MDGNQVFLGRQVFLFTSVHMGEFIVLQIKLTLVSADRSLRKYIYIYPW